MKASIIFTAIVIIANLFILGGYAYEMNKIQKDAEEQQYSALEEIRNISEKIREKTKEYIPFKEKCPEGKKIIGVRISNEYGEIICSYY